MGCRKKWKQYTLDDRSKWTVKEAAIELKCNQSTAYARLRSSSDPKHVFRPLNITKDKHGHKIYTLDDGSKWTAIEVAKHTGVAKSTASTRLSTHSDPNKVLAAIGERIMNKDAVEQYKTRMYYDPLGHWALINKNTGASICKLKQL